MRFFRYGTWLGFHGHEGWNYFTSPGGIIMGLIFLVIVGVIVYLIVSRSRDREDMKRYMTGGSSGNDALEILRSRFASGEINEEQFERMKKKLM